MVISTNMIVLFMCVLEREKEKERGRKAARNKGPTGKVRSVLFRHLCFSLYSLQLFLFLTTFVS